MRSAMSSCLAALRQPRLHVTIVCALRVGDREQESLAAVEETETQHVGAEERPQAVGDPLRERHPPAGSDQHLGAGGGIAVDARDRLLEPADRMMRELLAEAGNRAVADHPL